MASDFHGDNTCRGSELTIVAAFTPLGNAGVYRRIKLRRGKCTARVVTDDAVIHCGNMGYFRFTRGDNRIVARRTVIGDRNVIVEVAASKDGKVRTAAVRTQTMAKRTILPLLSRQVILVLARGNYTIVALGAVIGIDARVVKDGGRKGFRCNVTG